MKKLAVLLMIFIPVFAFSQGFFGGCRGGITGTQVQGDNYSGFDKAGITAGFIVGIPIGDYADFQTELLFVQKGSRKNPTKNDPTKYIMRLNYVEMPFLYRRQLKEKYGFEAGLSFGVLLKTEDVEFDENGVLPSRTPFEKYEFAGHAGIFYNINESNRVNLRYSHSILPIRPHQGGATYILNQGQYNLVLALTLEHRF